MSDNNKEKSIANNLISLLAPENLDSNKILSIFNEQFQAKIVDLLNLEEINKIDSDKDAILGGLKRLNFIEFLNENTIQITIKDSLTVLSLISIPHFWTSKEITDQFSILKSDNGKIERIYKKSLFWYLVTEDVETSKILEEELSSGSIVDSDKNKIKYEKLVSAEIKKRILKQINSHLYSKEVSDLKSNTLGNNNIIDGGNKLSWRKKSNDDTEEVRKGSKITSNAKQSGNFQRSSQVGLGGNQLGSGFYRERYNSDGQQNFNRGKQNFPKKEEIEIDLSKIHYSLKIMHKYSNADILLFYDKFRIQGVFNEPPKFDNFVDEICSKEKRKEFNFLKRERSLTFSVPISFKSNKFDEIKLNLNAPEYKIPTQNPLSGKLSGIQLNK